MSLVFLDYDQRLVDETREHVELAVADGFDGGEVEVSGERSEPPKQLDAQARQAARGSNRASR